MTDSIYANSGLAGNESLKAFKERPYCRTNHRDGLRNGAGRIAQDLGIVTLLSALLGIAYSASTLTDVVSGRKDAFAMEHQLLHFHVAFYVMSAVCIAGYVALRGGYQLVRQRLSVLGLLIGIWLFEIAYLLVGGMLWLVPGIGPSLAGATGLADGGLMVQFIILLPFWGPLVLLWIKRRHASPSGPAGATL